MRDAYYGIQLTQLQQTCLCAQREQKSAERQSRLGEANCDEIVNTQEAESHVKKLGTILVVEDDHETRVTLRHCLEQAGYFVVSTTNGQTALDLLKQMTLPEVILLDINMPILNGDQFLKVVQADPDLRSIPIIQMSAASNPRRLGVHTALAKPLELDKLLEVIESCLNSVPVRR